MLLLRNAMLMLLLLFSINYYGYSQNGQVTIFTTTNDKQSLLTESSDTITPKKVDATQKIRTIGIDTTTQYQPIDGFGFALTGGSAQHLIHMSAAARHNILQELFSTHKKGIGISYLRVS